MGEIDVVLAESDRTIREGDVAKLERSKDAARKKKGRLLRKVVDYRAEHAVGPQMRGPKGRFQSYDPDPGDEDSEDVTADG